MSGRLLRCSRAVGNAAFARPMVSQFDFRTSPLSQSDTDRMGYQARAMKDKDKVWTPRVNT